MGLRRASHHGHSTDPDKEPTVATRKTDVTRIVPCSLLDERRMLFRYYGDAALFFIANFLSGLSRTNVIHKEVTPRWLYDAARKNTRPPWRKGEKGEVCQVEKPEERYLRRALEFEGVLRACLYRYARNSSDVEELLQETYTRLLAAGSSDQPEIRSVRAFALTIARNVALDWLRHRQVVPIELVADLEALDVLDEGEQIEEIVNSHQELRLLAHAVSGLPRRCRQVFTLRKVYGYSQKEIAARLNISENTVEQHLTKAARRCADALFDQPFIDRRTRFFDRLRRAKKHHEENK